jgi:hypothetical protein
MAGQVQGIIGIQFIGQYLARDPSPAQLVFSQCKGSVQPRDLTIPLLVYAGYGAFIVCIFLLFFRTQYLRLKAEERHAADSILNFSSHSHGTPASSQGNLTT